VSFEPFQKKFTDEEVQSLKAKYENTPESMTTKDPVLVMVGTKVKYVKDYDRYNDLVVAFRLHVNSRLRDLEKLICMYELNKVEPRNVWERYSALLPEELEDLAQRLELTDIISRICALRVRLVAIDQKKNPIPADVPWIHALERLEVEREYLRSKGMQEGPEFEREAKRRAFLKIIMGDETFERLDARFKTLYGHGMGTKLNI